jgi:hypothetical protein
MISTENEAVLGEQSGRKRRLLRGGGFEPRL